MPTFELTASRWHKITQRLTAQATLSADEAKTALAGSRVEGFAGTEQTTLLKERAEEGLKALEVNALVMNAVGHIRAALGEANVKSGVSALLAQQETLNRRMKLLKEIVSAQKADMVSVENLADYKPFTEGAARSVYGRDPGISVRTLPRSVEAEFKAEIQVLQKQLYALADDANDKNRDKIKVELDATVAEIAGLSE